MNNNEVLTLLLPKKLEAGEEGSRIKTVLKEHAGQVTPLKDYLLPSFSFSSSIEEALFSAFRSGRVVRGFEDSQKKLDAEKKGLKNVDEKTGENRNERISRIAIVANDGSERFYRQTKRVVENHSPRVLAIHLNISSFELGEKLFGPKKRVLFLLINHKEAVSNLLLSLLNTED